jgi:5-methyltetrahydropteroyltriglutamate--homocysteine methyltransferase
VKFLKTVAGSFPPKKLPLDNAIKWAVDLQLKHGIDLISDGEQRTDMMSYFSSFPGLGMKPSGPHVKSKILPLPDPKSFIKLRDLEFVKDYLRSIGKEEVNLKVSVTGPISLAFSSAMNGLEHYSSIRDMNLYSDFAEAINPLVREIAKTGCYIQIDEPTLSARVMDNEQAVRIVNEALSGLSTTLHEQGKISVHVCGALNEPMFKALMSLDAPILNLAFGAPNVRKNLEVISKPVLQSAGKKLGIGCVSVQVMKRDDVEKPEIVAARLKDIMDRIGKDLIAYVHPDCGMRSTGEDAVERILEVLSLSVDLLKQDE